MNISETQRKILEIGKREFLKKGFKGASLRNIVAEAGFTKGAFYGYYPDKAALFEALVSEAADGLVGQFKVAQDAHFELIPAGKTSESRELSTEYLRHFVNYIYDYSKRLNSFYVVRMVQNMQITSTIWWYWKLNAQRNTMKFYVKKVK